ncbi:hypothetical protein Plo01_64720 [Planobispora longispora]|uniref:Uncharacterized protein n=3 Tax=Planobispora longispora TaxID=28887 RepID=A0A8J3W8T7_9ACTN|nr:hypothetical protein GCM10020093_018410 [Planobispora longispora]GIH80043.1 hypothetical protein Plo01_64720 [Planobispora longispora]
MPVSGPEDLEGADGHIEDAASMLDSHLLCHADDAGFYVPLPFEGPLFLAEDTIDGAGMVGSSQGLLGELIEIAPLIGVGLEPDTSLSDAEASRLVQDGGGPYAVEQITWLALHEACRASIASGHAIVYT